VSRHLTGLRGPARSLQEQQLCEGAVEGVGRTGSPPKGYIGYRVLLLDSEGMAALCAFGDRELCLLTVYLRLQLRFLLAASLCTSMCQLH